MTSVSKNPQLARQANMTKFLHAQSLCNRSQLFVCTENFLLLQNLEVIIVKKKTANELPFQTLQRSSAFRTKLLVLRGSIGLNACLYTVTLHTQFSLYLLKLYEPAAATTLIQLRCLAKPHKGAKMLFQIRILFNCSLQQRLKITNPSLHCSVQKGQHCPSSEVLFDRCRAVCVCVCVCVGGGERWLFTEFAISVCSSHMHIHSIIFTT